MIVPRTYHNLLPRPVQDTLMDAVPKPLPRGSDFGVTKKLEAVINAAKKNYPNYFVKE